MKVMCSFCLKQFDHGYPCICSHKEELALRVTIALENIAFELSELKEVVRNK